MTWSAEDCLIAFSQPVNMVCYNTAQLRYNTAWQEEVFFQCRLGENIFNTRIYVFLTWEMLWMTDMKQNNDHVFLLSS